MVPLFLWTLSLSLFVLSFAFLFMYKNRIPKSVFKPIFILLLVLFVYSIDTILHLYIISNLRNNKVLTGVISLYINRIIELGAGCMLLIMSIRIFLKNTGYMLPIIAGIFLIFLITDTSLMYFELHRYAHYRPYINKSWFFERLSILILFMAALILFLWQYLRTLRQYRYGLALTGLIILLLAASMVNDYYYYIGIEKTVADLLLTYGVNALVIYYLFHEVVTLQKELPLHLLSEREKNIIELVKEGLTNREIGKQLFVSEDTVKRDLKFVFKKLNIHKRSEILNLFNNSTTKK